MPSQQEIRRRIKSVEATSKITKAMKLVATTKLRRSKEFLERTQVYYKGVYEVVRGVFARVPKTDFLAVPDAKERSLFLVINSSLGLCGSYNVNVNRLAKEKVTENDLVIAVGEKAEPFWRSLGMGKNVLEVIAHFENALNFDLVSELGSKIYGKYASGEVNAVYVIYTEYRNSLSFVPRCLRLFPLDPEAVGVAKDPNGPVAEFEPNPEEVVRSVIPIYFNAMVYGALVESKVCEHASRRNAMEAATDNAADLRDDLKLKFNRARQAAITQEISEIVAGA